MGIDTMVQGLGLQGFGNPIPSIRTPTLAVNPRPCNPKTCFRRVASEVDVRSARSICILQAPKVTL